MDTTGFLVTLMVLVVFPTLLVVFIELRKAGVERARREQRNPYMKPWADRRPGDLS